VGSATPVAGTLDAAHTPSIVRETLAEYGAATRREVLKRLSALQASTDDADLKRYLYEPLADYPQRGGKMMRPGLCIATARAFGASVDDALACATAIELLHNALLIHDDIQDASLERRGRPTLHQIHGLELALNVGDALGLASLHPLMDNVQRLGPRVAARLMAETERMAWESAEGQALELGWRRDNRSDITEADYLRMVLKKTCWLATIHPCRVGALIGMQRRRWFGSTDEATLEAFIRFGFFLGAAFQIQDDLLNLEADAAYGKEREGDLVEGKRTLMLVHAWRAATPAEAKRLAQALDPTSGPPTPAQQRFMRQLIDHSGAIAYARGIAHGLAGAALHEFTQLTQGLPEGRDKAFLRGLITWVFERT
jgi:geranylgeranyl diphosphate synthase, type II